MLKIALLFTIMISVTNANAQSTTQAPPSGSTTSVPLTPIQKAVGAEPAASVVADLPAPGVPRRLKFGLVTATFGNALALNTGANQPITTINQLRADYKLSEVDSVRINQIASSEWGQSSQAKNNFQIGDMYLQYARAKIAHVFGDGVFRANARAYIPLSKAAHDKGQLTSLRTDLEIDKTFSKYFDIAIHIVPWVSLQSERSYDSVSASGSVTRKANSSANLAYYLAANCNFTKDLSLTHEMGLMRYWFKSDSDRQLVAQNREYLYLDTSLNYTINDTFGVGVGLSSYLNRDLYNQTNDFSLYRSDETDYYLTASANF